jgi:transcriptional regulator GlxA family with amidase domain
MHIAILAYHQMTALDAVGPYEVLARVPGVSVAWVAQEAGAIHTDGSLTLLADHTFTSMPHPDIVLVPGGREANAIGQPALLDWLRATHARTRFTTSVCTGSLILGAAGLLRGRRATSHWYRRQQLQSYGATPVRRRIVRDGRIVTAAGVSAGIDMGLYLAQQLAGSLVAKTIQLGIEYDPHPPFRSGSPEQAGWLTRFVAHIAMGRYYRRARMD